MAPNEGAGSRRHRSVSEGRTPYGVDGIRRSETRRQATRGVVPGQPVGAAYGRRVPVRNEGRSAAVPDIDLTLRSDHTQPTWGGCADPRAPQDASRRRDWQDVVPGRRSDYVDARLAPTAYHREQCHRRQDLPKRSATRPLERSSGPVDPGAGDTAFCMIVDEAHSLHEGMDRGRTNEGPSAFLHILRHGHRRRGGGCQIGYVIASWFERPDIGRKRSLLTDQFPCAAGIIDDRLDLAAVADDARVLQQPLNIRRREFRHPLEIEITERRRGNCRVW